MLIQPTFMVIDLKKELIERTITNISDTASFIDIFAFGYCSNLTTANFPNCTTIGSSAFYQCSALTTANFPSCTTIGSYAFNTCKKLKSISFPNCMSIGSYAFANCNALTTASFPACTNIMNNTFVNCSSLTTANFPNCTTIGNLAFYCCYKLISLYLMSTSLVTLSNSNAFTSTPIGGYSTSAGQFGSIYVPSSLLASYKTAARWSVFSSRFVGV